jgi:hypothetical protein
MEGSDKISPLLVTERRPDLAVIAEIKSCAWA